MSFTKLTAVAAALAFATSAAQGRDYYFREIPAEFGPEDRVAASMNDFGTVVFHAGSLAGERTIYIYDGTTTRVLVNESGPFSAVADPAISNDGLVVFRGRIDGIGWGIFGTIDGVDFNPIVEPDPSVWPDELGGLSINDDGAVAFWADTADGGWGVFRIEDGVITTIVDDSGVVSRWSLRPRHTRINASGAVAFRAELDDERRAILAGDGGPIRTIAAEGDEYDYFHEGSGAIHDSGDVYFSATLVSGTMGVYRGDGTTVTPVVDSTGPYDGAYIGAPCVNADGTIVFWGYVAGDGYTLYTGPVPDTMKLIRQYDRFYGATVPQIAPFDLNDSGQVVMRLWLGHSADVSKLYLALPITDPDQPIYVKADATGYNDGTSWENAFRCLTDALNFAESGDHIWIAAGVYKPGQYTSGTTPSREQSFLIPSGVSVYGGFAGYEETLEEREGLFDETIFSGDVEDDDEPGFINYDDNVYVVAIAGDGSAGQVLIDGVSFYGGATGLRWISDVVVYGAGLAVREDASVRNCRFIGNRADGPGIGGGAHVETGTSSFEQCVFAGNYTGTTGGAAIHIGGEATVSLADCEFTQNTRNSSATAAVYVEACDGVTITGCTFTENEGGVSVEDSQVDIYECAFQRNEGTALIVENARLVTVIDCEFSENTGDVGGGIHAAHDGGTPDSTTMVVRDCRFHRNRARMGGGFCYGGGSALIEDCEFTENSVTCNTVWHIGGGLHLSAGAYIVRRCTFVGNSALPSGRGGGVYVVFNGPDAVLVDCTFIGNQAGLGGGIACGIASPLVAQCVFAGNAAVDGGAVHAEWESLPSFVDSVIVGNSAEASGGGLFSVRTQDRPRVYNTIVWANQDAGGTGEPSQISGGLPVVKYSCVQGWTGDLGGIGNFGDDPLFIDPLGPDGLPGTGDEDYRLSAGSPCIDRGSNWLVPPDLADLDDDGDVDEFLPLDFEGDGRFFNDPDTPNNSCGDVAIVDVGPYEFGNTGPQPCVGDVDGDGVIGLEDLSCLLSKYRVEHTDPDFDPVCDFNVDGVINLSDLATLLPRYGEVCD